MTTRVIGKAWFGNHLHSIDDELDIRGGPTGVGGYRMDPKNPAETYVHDGTRTSRVDGNTLNVVAEKVKEGAPVDSNGNPFTVAPDEELYLVGPVVNEQQAQLNISRSRSRERG